MTTIILVKLTIHQQRRLNLRIKQTFVLIRILSTLIRLSEIPAVLLLPKTLVVLKPVVNGLIGTKSFLSLLVFHVMMRRMMNMKDT